MTRWWWTLVAALVVGAPLPGSAQETVNPHGTLPDDLDCSACHTPTGWTPLRSPLAFTHGARGGFLITGAHRDASCASCHLDLKFNGPDVEMNDCAGCHLDVHEGRMVQECVACHTTTSFQDVDGLLIHDRTSFPLTGAHRQVTCESCHTDDQGGAFTPLDTECVSCHLDAYQGAVTVDHVAAGYPTDCTQCHSTLAWGDTPSFDHAAVSGGFALVGAHRDARCASCHAVPGMELLFTPSDQNDCVACHQADFDRRHGGTSIPTTCASCHSANSWDVENFDHALTGFALLGSHARTECSACHNDGGGLKYPPPATPEDCVACHQADYDHEHAGSGFPTTCLSCHNLNDWDDASFDHASTAFPLVGAHTGASCAACHGPPANLAGAFAGPEECVVCHQGDYDREHAGSGFPTTCLSCHTQSNWDAVGVDHVALSGGFALEGAHTSISCEQCHTVPGYALKFTVPAGQEDCVACHQTDYDANHAGSGLPTTCLSCHSVNGWDNASFDHAVQTGFALEGPHVSLTCTTCHATPTYTLLFPPPTSQEDCVACHQADYDANHAGSGFPTTCLTCHQSDRWDGATVDHGSLAGGFELLGAHSTTPCASCHVIPGYTLLFATPSGPDDCLVCHQGDYQSAHGGQGYPTDCAACHTVAAWEPSTFNHDAQYFPIYSGEHQGEWNSCADCHTSPSDFAVFSCITCHEHNQSDMDSEHQGVNGYVYASASCLACHPTGKAD